MMEILLLLTPVVPFLFVRFAKRWRQTLFIMMVFLVIEGAIRKWVLPQFQAQIYFVKDGLLMLAAIGYVFERQVASGHKQLQAGLRVWLLVYFVFCVAQAANPYNPSLLMWLVGFKSHMLYIILVFMLPYAFATPGDLDRSLRLYISIMIPFVAVGLVQYFSPSDAYINQQAVHTVAGVSDVPITLFGEDNRARASGTFPYIGGYAAFVTAMFYLALPGVLVAGGTLRASLPAFVMAATAGACVFTTGSRAVALTTLGFLPITLLFSIRARLVSSSTLTRILIGSSFAVAVVTLIAMDAVEAISHRSQNADDPVMRLLSPLTELYGAFEASPFWGTGLGTNHHSASTLMSSQVAWWLDGNIYEMETARIMQEGGVVGFVIVYGLRVYLVWFAAYQSLLFKVPQHRALAVCIAVYGIAYVPQFIVNNPVTGIYYWCSIGLLYAMCRLEGYQSEPGA